MKYANLLLTALAFGTYAAPALAAIETPTLPGGKTPTVVVFEKSEGEIRVADALPMPGSVGVTISESEVARTVEILKKLGIKPQVTKVESTSTTVYKIADINCTENGDRRGATRCETAGRKLKLDESTISELIALFVDYRGTRADFERYAEFGMGEISCKITEVGSINATYRQCNFTY